MCNEHPISRGFISIMHEEITLGIGCPYDTGNNGRRQEMMVQIHIKHFILPT